MTNAADQIRNAILGRYPLIYLLTWEESRVLQLLEAFSTKLFGPGISFQTWSCVTGFSQNGSTEPITNAISALKSVLASEEKGFVVLKDFSSFMSDPSVSRALRDAYYALQGKEKYIFIVSPEKVIPESLKKEILLIDVGLPDEGELLKLIKRMQPLYPQATFPDELIGKISFALKGLTVNEATHVLHKIFRSKKIDAEEVLRQIFAEKEMIVKKSGYLEFVSAGANLSEIGGLDNLKDWLVKRERLFSRQALQDGMPVPRGILIMGISGCGKSLCAKATSALWKVPLFRLDMNLVFSGMYGNAELAFHRALKTVEAVAPAVLWIDEIENSLGMEEGKGGGVNSHIFSYFLTWMQEKPPLVFIAATANRIQAIPAEVIRKGRFDQVFFVDLPNDEERKQIFEIHLKRNGADATKFDLVFLAAATKGWNGAEIEEAIASARVDAYQENREFTIDDITRNTSRMVALSKTMEDQMKRIRSWAFGRATPASKYAVIPRM
jgi:ATPase family associated with various cellular activities (AAA)